MYENECHIFVDRDMYMRYVGGGVGHADATLPEKNNDNDVEMEGEEDNWEDMYMRYVGGGVGHIGRCWKSARDEYLNSIMSKR